MTVRGIFRKTPFSITRLKKKLEQAEYNTAVS